MGDITKVDENEIDDFNMMTWGFPCTDLSVAGKQKGFIDEAGNKTRSGMYYEGIRILRKKKPALSIIENVKNLTGKKFKNEFDMVLNDLEDAGYNSYWKVLNAKDYGVPQNRERVFIVSIRKDLDNGKFKFPEPFNNGIRLIDMLEDNVDEKFYVSQDKVNRFLSSLNSKDSLLYDPCQVKREGKSREYNEICPTLTSRDYKDPRIVNENVIHQNKIGIDKSYNNPKEINVANCISTREDRGVSNRQSEGTAVLETPDTSYCLDASYYKGTTIQHYIDKKKRQLVFEHSSIPIPQATKQGYINCDMGGVFDMSYPESKTRRGRVQDYGNISPTITATETGVCRVEPVKKTDGCYTNTSPAITSQPLKDTARTLKTDAHNGLFDGIRIRKLTPKECFRLMGFTDEAFDKAKYAGISNSQLYKQAGNSIVVDVLYYIYKELYSVMPYLFDDLKLSSFFSGIGAFECALDRLYDEINSVLDQ